eukprot:IDg22248t1
MNAEQCLGLVLSWHRTRGSTFCLCMLFGITSSVCSLFIRFARRLLLKVFVQDHDARIAMPSLQEVQQFTSAFTDKYHSLQNVYSVCDGLKLNLEQSGSMHDSMIAEWGGIYEKLQEAFDEHGGICVVDSAFAKGRYPFVLKSAQDETSAEGAAEVIKLRQATSARQASEWGMRALQGSFPRIKDQFIYEERGERKLMLLVLVHLFNFRARRVGINQILSSYMPLFSVEASSFIHTFI